MLAIVKKIKTEKHRSWGHRAESIGRINTMEIVQNKQEFMEMVSS